jgi:hypothetical protein
MHKKGREEDFNEQQKKNFVIAHSIDNVGVRICGTGIPCKCGRN